MFEVFACAEKRPDFKSSVIATVSGCVITHVGIIEDNERIFHATGPAEYPSGKKANGFHMIDGVDFKDFFEVHDIHHRFQVRVLNPDHAKGWLRGNCGKDYSETQLLAFLPIPRWLRAWALTFLGDQGRELICSESILRFGIECCALEIPDNPDFLKPVAALELMRAVGI